MKNYIIRSLIAACLCFLFNAESQAGVPAALLKTTMQTLQIKFGLEIAETFGESGSRVVARRIEALAAKHGDVLVTDAVQKVGPRLFRYIEEVGEDGALKCLKLTRRVGDDAVWIISKPGRTSIFLQHGDDAADAMIKHREIAEAVLSKYGTTGAQALRNASSHSARRIATLNDTGELTRFADPNGILKVIARHGDRATAWVWKNKGSLAVAAVAASFINNPEPYLSGAKSAGDALGDHVVGPAVAAATSSIDWTWLSSLCVFVVAGITLRWVVVRRR